MALPSAVFRASLLALCVLSSLAANAPLLSRGGEAARAQGAMGE